MPCPSCHGLPSKIFQVRHHKKISEDMKRSLNCHVDNDFIGEKILLPLLMVLPFLPSSDTHCVNHISFAKRHTVSLITEC